MKVVRVPATRGGKGGAEDRCDVARAYDRDDRKGARCIHRRPDRVLRHEVQILLPLFGPPHLLSEGSSFINSCANSSSVPKRHQ